MSKYLIINADDFGYNVQQNSAIKELLENKLITSVSVLTVGNGYDDAALWLKAKGIPAGVHLTINSDSRDCPWKSVTGSRHLGKNGTLFFESSDITRHGRHKAVYDELEAQFSLLAGDGVGVDHADNHCGTLYGINLRRFYVDAYKFCSGHSLPYRFPKTPRFIERQLGRNIPSSVKALHRMLVNKGIGMNVRLIDDLISNPWNMERIGSYDTLKMWYLEALDDLSEGVTEMFLHPALPFDDRISEWTKRVFEYELLKSGDLLQKAEDKNIKVISWNDFRNGMGVI